MRRPKKVSALQGKKIISIATGSLHCVACSDEGEVFTWGDNDEGQLGDGTANAIQRPRLVSALQVIEDNERIVTFFQQHVYKFSESYDCDFGF